MRTFDNNPILSWAIDDFDVVKEACSQQGFDLNEYVKRYNQKTFESNILPLLTNTPFKMNLGGATDKDRLISIDKPIGVFNFSLASKGLYHLQEYYSDELKRKDPNRFADIGLLSGIVPSNLVDSVYIGGEKKFLFRDKEKGGEYYVVKRNMGQTAINEGIPNAKYKYASRTKKVYQTYKKKGGKVKYVEIYSLFYYAGGNDFKHAVRHFPAFMVANYLESIGIKTRIYMTRFVQIDAEPFTLKKKLDTGVMLPMGNTQLGATRNNKFEPCLLIQPIIAKEFMQEPDLPYSFCITSASMRNIYESCAKFTYSKETRNPSNPLYGNVLWSQEDYWEGIERYRNKYKEYVDLGIFKSKEITAESMLFFHDQSIEGYLSAFFDEIGSIYGGLSDYQVVLEPEVNRFFYWWMQTSGNIIKHKVNLFNSSSYHKDFLDVVRDIEKSKLELETIIQESTHKSSSFSTTDADIFKSFGEMILKTLNIIDDSGQLSPSRYMNSIISEITTFADGMFYPTTEESVEKMTALKLIIDQELKNL